MPITFKVVDMSCPICKSPRTRSKVGDENGVWWYICDNWDILHLIQIKGVGTVDVRKDKNGNDCRFYFSKDYGRTILEYRGHHYIRLYGNTWTRAHEE